MRLTRFQFYSEKVTGCGGYKDILVFIRMGQKMAILIKKNTYVIDHNAPDIFYNRMSQKWPS